MARVPVQEQKLPGLQRHKRIPVDAVHRFSTAHIHDLHIIVAVPRKRCEARMGADGHQLSLLQHLCRIHLKRTARGVQRPVHTTALQQLPFFLSDLRQTLQQDCIHSYHSPRILNRQLFFIIQGKNGRCKTSLWKSAAIQSLVPASACASSSSFCAAFSTFSRKASTNLSSIFL